MSLDNFEIWSNYSSLAFWHRPVFDKAFVTDSFEGKAKFYPFLSLQSNIISKRDFFFKIKNKKIKMPKLKEIIF